MSFPVNFFQRRVAFIALASILLKASLPESSWAQIGMFAGLGLAIWQLRSAVFRACIERLLNPLIFYLCDSLCVGLFFASYRIVFYQPLHIVSALAIGLLFGLLPVYRYRKLVKTIRKSIEEQAAHAAESKTNET
jgi:hypothetical protein